MDLELIGISLLTGLITTTITAIITFLSTRSKILLDLTAEYDKELRKDRLEAYRQLWPLLKPLARFSAEGPLTYELVKSTSENMRDWYFDTGGIYLSHMTRIPYFELKAALEEIINDPQLSVQSGSKIDDLRVKKILKLGTDLRTSLADDIGTRKGSFT